MATGEQISAEPAGTEPTGSRLLGSRPTGRRSLTVMHMSRTRRGQIIVFTAAIFLVVSACGGGDADPGDVLADYQAARNSGDVDAVVSFYAEDAVVKDHPLDNDGVATGADEIRALEEQVPAIQGSGDGIEYIDMQVSGSTATFNHRFFYGSDGVRSGGSAGCAGGVGNTATVEDGKITLVDWGTEDPSQCS